MERNKKETFVFTLIMCFFMVLGMSIYNVALTAGFSTKIISGVAAGFLPAFIVALALDVFVVGKFAKGLAAGLVKEQDPMIKKVMLISSFMVTGMVICMSLYGTVAHYGITDQFPAQYLKMIGMNFICALPLQMLVVGPLTRLLFGKIYSLKSTGQKMA